MTATLMELYTDPIALRLAYYIAEIRRILDGRLGILRLSGGAEAIAIRNADDWTGDMQAPQVEGLEVVLEPAYALSYIDFASGGLIQNPTTRITLKQWDLSKTTVIEADLLARNFSLIDRRSVVRVPRYRENGIIDQTSMVIQDYLESFN
jgi:hypothetical protein